MGALSAILAATLLSAPLARPSTLFDHLALRAPDESPVHLVALRDGAWRVAAVDTFPGGAGEGAEIHLRARDLGEAGHEPPAGARWRVRARSDDGQPEREGFLVPSAPGATPAAPLGALDAASFAGRTFSLRFPEGSAFYRDLRVYGAEQPLVRAVRMRLVTTLPAGLEITRSEEDFRWTIDRLDVGALFARRLSSAAARALIRYTDPRPQTAWFSDDGIVQSVTIDLPAALLSVASGVTLENAFEVDAGTRVLVPGAARWQGVGDLAPGAPYDWIVLANDGGALFHRLVLEGKASALAPRLYARTETARSAWQVGYRIEHVEEAGKASEGTQDQGFVLGEYVALLGDGKWARDLSADADRTARLASELGHPLSRWHATLEEVR